VEFDLVRVDLVSDLGEPDGLDFVAVLGSDAHAYERVEPWVEPELEWLRGLHDRGLPILGICYGAQALAVALGGSVRRAPEPEIGWISVPTDAPDLVESGPWFTWHQDMIELPAGAREIATNDVCPQAYAFGPHLGLQFHPEVTTAVLMEWAAGRSGAEQLERKGIEPEAYERDAQRYVPAARAAAMRLFDGFAARVSAVRPVGAG
jgi:GMP synthase-like glutamine amidotransferase